MCFLLEPVKAGGTPSLFIMWCHTLHTPVVIDIQNLILNYNIYTRYTQSYVYAEVY